MQARRRKSPAAKGRVSEPRVADASLKFDCFDDVEDYKCP
jgi:hypothetical protein